MTEYKLIQCEKHFDGAVLKIVLNAPKANVLEAAMIGEIRAAIEPLYEDTGLKLLVFEGAGKHFSFGASVPEHTKDRAAMMLNAFHGMFLDVICLAVPTMAIVRGQCLGGGMELAIFCNFIVADSTAMFGQPEIVLGVFPPPASIILPKKVGQAYADDLALTGRSVSAEEGHRIGLVNLLAGEGEDPWAVASKWIEKHIIPKSSACLRIANRAVRMDFFRRLLEDLPRMEGLYLKELMETHDANEGINAFIEKRQPAWKGE
jgi:cyclohexa-1,5-dienecarbonyl-CoA hydratase